MSPGLYPRLLASDWSRLHESLRRFHVQEHPLRARGVFRVRHGDGAVARGLLWLMGMPRAGEAVPVELDVRACDGGGETWLRTFAGRPLVTTQLPRAGCLAERSGAIELRFRLEVEDADLVYRQVSAALRIGPLAVPLPRWLAPVVEARERPSDPPGRARIRVSVSAPVVGFLISYEGTIAREEDAP